MLIGLPAPTFDGAYEATVYIGPPLPTARHQPGGAGQAELSILAAILGSLTYLSYAIHVKWSPAEAFARVKASPDRKAR